MRHHRPRPRRGLPRGRRGGRRPDPRLARRDSEGARTLAATSTPETSWSSSRAEGLRAEETEPEPEPPHPVVVPSPRGTGWGTSPRRTSPRSSPASCGAGARAQALARVHRRGPRRARRRRGEARRGVGEPRPPPPAASPCDACDRSLSSQGKKAEAAGKKAAALAVGDIEDVVAGDATAKARAKARRTAGDAAAKEGGERDARDRDPAEAKKPEWVATLESVFTATAAARGGARLGVVRGARRGLVKRRL